MVLIEQFWENSELIGSTLGQTNLRIKFLFNQLVHHCGASLISKAPSSQNDDTSQFFICFKHLYLYSLQLSVFAQLWFKFEMFPTGSCFKCQLPSLWKAIEPLGDGPWMQEIGYQVCVAFEGFQPLVLAFWLSNNMKSLVNTSTTMNSTLPSSY